MPFSHFPNYISIQYLLLEKKPNFHNTTYSFRTHTHTHTHTHEHGHTRNIIVKEEETQKKKKKKTEPAQDSGEGIKVSVNHFLPSCSRVFRKLHDYEPVVMVTPR